MNVIWGACGGRKGNDEEVRGNEAPLCLGVVWGLRKGYSCL